MIETFVFARELFLKTIPFVIATIIDKKGSSPREVGASMIVTQNGLAQGTIGGGAIENEAIKKAKSLIEENSSSIEEYILTDNTAASIGMVCGGSNKIFLKYIDTKNKIYLEIFNRLIENYKEKETKLIFDLERLNIFANIDGEIFPNETISGNSFQLLVKDSIKVFVFGGGHVSKAFVKILDFLKLNSVVVEDRAEFLEEKDFPNSKRILIGYEDIDTVNITSDDYVCIITRGHTSDSIVLEKVLEKNPQYIGVIGSKRKVALMFKNISDKYSKTMLDKIHSPIGLDIGAQTPEEIAISIAAEIIGEYRAAPLR
ncbi:XdhC family protein [Treponema phagedenis]|uniref:XdhC family protein n=1 Tax=Treponema phagedenis TaxID=162 RepID=UPI0001F63D2D|nr:XdhC/CoxI family protein [Treponema phagedenis]EFW37461.1 putative xanthine dehydrogenase accessory factor [Treponema phagedenis F0421]TYT78285.1 XdhC family protein [Treponema phagedenis]